MKCDTKIVVFDMDETLGYFIELGMFWDGLQNYIKANNIKISIDQHLFNKVLDLFPEFLRPNIINILNYLKKKKQKGHCNKLMIYTNNQGPSEWAKHIISYLEYKLNYNLFDQIIAAFKINGKQVEICRTTHMKTYSDFIKCTKIPSTTQICFLDDVFYPGMNHDNIHYINVKPYVYDLPFETMINRLLKADVIECDPTSCREYILNYMKKFAYSHVGEPANLSMQRSVSKKIMQEFQVFFKSKSRIKIDLNKTNKTHKTNKTKVKKIKMYKNKTKKRRNV